MEIILVIIAIILISRRKGTFNSIPIEDLPIGRNEDKFFDETAFTMYYHKLKDTPETQAPTPSESMEEQGGEVSD